MMEKIKGIFNNDKVKGCCKKVFTKNKIRAIIVIVVVVGALHLGYSLMFRVNGIVRKVDANTITVANFFNTQTINTGDYQIDTTKIIVGERVEVIKNLSGQVLEIRGGNRKQDMGNRQSGNNKKVGVNQRDKQNKQADVSQDKQTDVK